MASKLAVQEADFRVKELEPQVLFFLAYVIYLVKKRCILGNIRCILGNIRCILGNIRCIPGDIRCILDGIEARGAGGRLPRQRTRASGPFSCTS